MFPILASSNSIGLSGRLLLTKGSPQRNPMEITSHPRALTRGCYFLSTREREKAMFCTLKDAETLLTGFTGAERFFAFLRAFAGPGRVRAGPGLTIF